MTGIKIKNHFIPQMHLKNWSTSNNVYVYKKIVQHHSVPLWKKHSLKGIGYVQYLYVNTKNGQENDELELWFDKSFEAPAEKALSKVISGKRLTRDDYTSLINFVALQDLRTPKNYIEHLTKSNENDFNKILGNVLDDIEKQGIPKYFKTKTTPHTHDELPLKVNIEKLDGSISVQANTLVGRSSWLWSIKYLLRNTAHNLHNHKWAIIRPAFGLSWLTGDSPVVKLNYYSENNYDLGGGWGRKGTEILMPLSPEYMLFTSIGRKPPVTGTKMSRKNTILLNKLIVENCHRYVISNTDHESIKELHNRVTSPEIIKHEQDEWAKWHKEQKEAEEKFFS